MHIFEMVQNSLNAGARNVQVQVEENLHNNVLRLVIKDDGKGIKPSDLEHVKDIFYSSRSRRGKDIGIGLSLLNAACQATEGDLDIDSVVDKGTTLVATMKHDHIDRPPLGDLADLYASLMVDTPQNVRVHWRLGHRVNLRSYEYTDEQLLDKMRLSNFKGPGTRKRVVEFFKESEGMLGN